MFKLLLILPLIITNSLLFSQTIVSRIEAENATLLGTSTIDNVFSNFSGTGYVEGLTTTNSGVTFTVNVPSAGQYYLSLHYGNGDANNASLNIYLENNKITTTSLPPTKDWNAWTNKTEFITLQAGTNTISYQKNADNVGVVNIDYIWVTKVLGNGIVNQEITSQNDEILIAKYVQLPNTLFSNGSTKQPRINTFAYAGNRNFVGVERSGIIYELKEAIDGTVTYEEFLNVATAIQANTGRDLDTSSIFHGGFRGLAFHPDFSTNGKFYTSVMESRPSQPNLHHYISDSTTPIEADSVLVEWTYNFVTNTVLTGSYREVFRVGMPVYDHPIKQITFNDYASPTDSDYGLLYIAHGDGSVESAKAGGGMNNDALGKILRIDPLESGNDPYTIPNDNPFVGDPTYLDEIYALGCRNPHTLSFNTNGSNVHLVSGEPGRDNIEEINIITKGGNYGWPEREGTFVHLEEKRGIIQGNSPLPDNDANNGYQYPTAQYGHQGNIGQGFVGLAIAGGYVYEKEDFKHYIFSDFPLTGNMYFCNYNEIITNKTTLNVSESPTALEQSQIYQYKILFDHDNNSATAPIRYDTMREILALDPNYDAGSNRADTRFGRDKAGNIYILNKRNGWVYIVKDVMISPDITLSTTTSSPSIERPWGVYPNPFYKDQKIHLEGIPLEEITAIVCYDLNGIEIKLPFDKETATIDASHLETGVYVLQIECLDGNKKVSKLMTTN